MGVGHVGRERGLSLLSNSKNRGYRLQNHLSHHPELVLVGRAGASLSGPLGLQLCPGFRPSVALKGVESSQGSRGPQPSGKVTVSGGEI